MATASTNRADSNPTFLPPGFLPSFHGKTSAATGPAAVAGESDFSAGFSRFFWSR
jgi:hypothetical protein